MKTVLEVQNISKRLGNFQLNDISLEIGNEYFVLLGPTGAGKSVLIEIIAGMFTPDKGKITINGLDATFMLPEKRKIGFVPQDYALFPHLNVFKNIEYGLRVKGETNYSKVEELAQTLGIEHLLYRDPKTLSGGEKQRVALARALVIQPQLILLDEPLSAVDLRTKEKLMEELRKVHSEFAVPIVHVTHSFIEAAALSDRVAVMMDGEVKQVGEIKHLFSQARDEQVADFIGVKGLFEKLLNYLE
ncbi:MAG: ATP-binding cassette domain-containing protein [Archaeoglobaceae archaeon]